MIRFLVIEFKYTLAIYFAPLTLLARGIKHGATWRGIKHGVLWYFREVDKIGERAREKAEAEADKKAAK